jgi:hypothetical protein
VWPGPAVWLNDYPAMTGRSPIELRDAVHGSERACAICKRGR